MDQNDSVRLIVRRSSHVNRLSSSFEMSHIHSTMYWDIYYTATIQSKIKTMYSQGQESIAIYNVPYMHTRM